MIKIYKYTNESNGKVYIGQTSTTLEYRAGCNGRNYIESHKFYNAIKKYGWGKFKPEILSEVESLSLANLEEEKYIAIFNATDDRYGYNIQKGGNNKTLSDDAKNIISNKAKKRYQDITKNPMYGKKHSSESLKKQSDAKLGCKNPMYGTKWNETQRSKCGTKGKTLQLSESRRKSLSDNMKKIVEEKVKKSVICITDNRVFDSVTECAVEYGVSISTLSGHLNGYQKTCSGRVFKFLSINNESATTNCTSDISPDGSGGGDF